MIAYRWIEGITLHELRKQGQRAAFAIARRAARPRARVDRAHRCDRSRSSSRRSSSRATRSSPTGRARKRIGRAARRRAAQGDRSRRAAAGVRLGLPRRTATSAIATCSSIKRGDRWRINGVIDWETTTHRLAARRRRQPVPLRRALRRRRSRTAFERGYRDAGGELPDGWLLTSRLLDATWLVDMLDDAARAPRAYSPTVPRLLAKLVADALSDR